MSPDELRALSEEQAYKIPQALQASGPDRTDDRRDTEENGLVEQQRLFQKFRLGAGKFERILGVRFFNGTVEEAVDYIARVRGYTVVPAAPALARIDRDFDYARALLAADLAIADSGFMVLLWRILRRRKIARISGLKYLKLLLADQALYSSGKTFLILPTESSRTKALRWLTGEGIQIGEENTYVAPIYGNEVIDKSLVDLLDQLQPEHVIIAIGGGTQEKLGYYLREHLNYRPAIHCIGAALGFLTGDQPRVPMWADRFYLGWFVRVLTHPRRFAPRYLGALRCILLVGRFGPEQPTQL
jgi:UDP-N-acetyl-D-mannosaminuronic acid transferase (WecB/TagA/CpsF family)